MSNRVFKLSLAAAPTALAICLAAAPMASAQETAGSLYPSDISVALPGAPQTASATGAQTRSFGSFAGTRIATVDTAIATPGAPIAKALGPAAYVLTGTSAPEEFRTAIRRAIGAHPTYHAQLTTLDEARAARKEARSSLMPQIGAQLVGDYAISRDFDPNTDNVVESLQPREQITGALTASQLVFDGGATFQRMKSARARSAEFENAISTRINDLAMGALAAYHDLLTHQALDALGGAFIRRHERILNDVRERERLGAGSMADVTRAVARLAAARARVAEIRESAYLAEIRYLEYFDDTPGVLSRPVVAGVNISNRDEATQIAATQNPEIAAAVARADAAQADYSAAKAARLPEVRLSVNAVKYDLFQDGDDFDVRAGVNLNYQIFGGGVRSAAIDRARSQARQQKYAEEQTRIDVTREAAIAFERTAAANIRLDALEAAVVAHDTTRELVLERYKVARGDLIDVLQSENDYFEAGVAYLTALANRDLAIYNMMEHTGDLLEIFSPRTTQSGSVVDVAREFVNGGDRVETGADAFKAEAADVVETIIADPVVLSEDANE